jgi:hypothetical protein
VSRFGRKSNVCDSERSSILRRPLSYLKAMLAFPKTITLAWKRRDPSCSRSPQPGRPEPDLQKITVTVTKADCEA